MKNPHEINDTDVLLDAVLADEHWHSLNGSLKREALAALGVARRKRALRSQMGQLVCATLLLAGAGWWLHPAAPKREPVAQRPEPSDAPAAGDRFLTEEAMLAMFPRGSCVVAEVNGQKELVFFDAQKAAEGFVLGKN